MGHEVEAVVDDCSSHEVVPSLMALIDRGEQEHHVFVELSSSVPLTNRIDALDNDLIDDFTCVPIDKDDPLIDEVSFCSEFNFNCLKHFNTSNNVV